MKMKERAMAIHLAAAAATGILIILLATLIILLATWTGCMLKVCQHLTTRPP